MILRRVISHFRKQEWTAIGLEFLIVVFGVGVALMAQQALNDYQSRSDYDRAVVDLRGGIANVYFTSKERLAVAGCRKARYRELGTLLMQTDTPWPGSPRDYGAASLESVFPLVTRSPRRIWISSLWDAELDMGTFELMDENSRLELSFVFSIGLMAETLQNDINDMEANLQALAYPLDMSLSDRLRYYDLLARTNAASDSLELIATKNIQVLEATGFLAPVNTAEAIELREGLARDNARMLGIYGDCVKEIVFPHLENPADTEGITP